MTPRFLAACRREPVDRPPVWLMRQAGRYLPEYREVRARAGGFLEMVKTPEHAVEVTLQPVRRLGVDAAILFADILLVLEPMGLDLQFEEGRGPRILNPVRGRDDAGRLRVPRDAGIDLAYVMETVRGARAGLPAEVPLIGFAGAPFTVATYAAEDGAETEELLLEKLARVTTSYLLAQAQAGAQALMLFDSWASRALDVAFRHARTVLATVRELVGAEVPLIYFAKGAGARLDDLATIGADVIGIDATVDLREARARIGDRVAIQGNLDNEVLRSADPAGVRDATMRLLEAAGPRPGYIANLGHGVLPETPVLNVAAFVDTIRTWKWPASPRALRPAPKT